MDDSDGVGAWAIKKPGSYIRMSNKARLHCLDMLVTAALLALVAAVVLMPAILALVMLMGEYY